MKKLTLSIDEVVLHRARVKAIAMNTSVAALVRSFLIELTNEETYRERRKRLECETIAAIPAFRAGDRLSRVDVHERNVLS